MVPITETVFFKNVVPDTVPRSCLFECVIPGRIELGLPDSGTKYRYRGLVTYITGNTVCHMTGNTVRRITGNTVRRITGNTVRHITGNTVRSITGNTVRRELE